MLNGFRCLLAQCFHGLLQRPIPVMHMEERGERYGLQPRLLQNPELARLAADTGMLQILEDRPGVELFLDLLRLLKDRPDLKTGSIIEHYRDSEHQHSLAKLSAWEHPEHSGDVEAEFRGVLEQLQREARRAQTERLMNKEQLSGLSSEEKTELKRLLAEKSGSPPV